MKIKEIEITPKEIADLILELQGQRKKCFIPSDIISQALSQANRGIAVEEQEL